ncbi:unnamed protein product [Ectocarpus sp. 4 AP-2014]
MGSPVKDVYLIAYNLACASGWSYVLFVCVSHILAGNEPQALYDEVEKVLQIVQTAALMEVLHAMLGVVRSPWVTTLMQVSSRIVLVWGFMWAVPSTQGQLGSMLCITSWACVEIPRYLFYTFGVLKSSPYPLFYLRYSLFAVLYPTGIAGEVMTMLAGLPDLKVRCFSFSLHAVSFCCPPVLHVSTRAGSSSGNGSSCDRSSGTTVVFVTRFVAVLVDGLEEHIASISGGTTQGFWFSSSSQLLLHSARICLFLSLK